MARRTKTDDPEWVTSGTSSADETSTGGESATAMASGVVDSAKQAASQAKEAAGQVLEQAKDQAATRADQQRETLASGFDAVAQAFRSLGNDLSSKEQGPVAEYAAEMGHAVSGQIEKFAKYLRERDVRKLVSDTEGFARRSPAVFLGGAFVLGIAASRFLKSSRPAPPDFIANMPDPNRALPPATTPPSGLGPTKTASDPLSTPPFWATPETGSQGTPSTPSGRNPTGGL